MSKPVPAIRSVKARGLVVPIAPAGEDRLHDDRGRRRWC